VYEPFVQQLAAATEKLVVGDGLANPDADVGPLTNLEVLERTERHVQDARDRGGRVLCGGRRPEQLGRGNFYEPTVVADGTPDMLLMHEETFGPAVGVAPYTTLEEAIDLANGTPAGLAAYAYTRDTTEVFTLGRRLDFGNVAVNNVDAGIINAPYGGRKQSGIGLEHGREGMEEYLQTKHLRVRYGKSASRP
jgi:succinate-semialdehyde dehydrogenase / glutarate-semialdehyde dehydrogenase